MSTINEATVMLGDGAVTIRRSGSSSATVANILAIEISEDHADVFLDRLVHRMSERNLGEFQARGAISTILSGPTHLLDSRPTDESPVTNDESA